jgi:hypothetical protein
MHALSNLLGQRPHRTPVAVIKDEDFFHRGWMRLLNATPRIDTASRVAARMFPAVQHDVHTKMAESNPTTNRHRNKSGFAA